MKLSIRIILIVLHSVLTAFVMNLIGNEMSQPIDLWYFMVCVLMVFIWSILYVLHFKELILFLKNKT